MALTTTPYQRAVDILEGLEPRGMKPGLERTVALLEELGNPHQGLRGVLVAGTNGKGSVCALVDSVVRAAGLHAVTLTKPHLRSYCERIAIDGRHISESDFGALIDSVASAADRLPGEVQPTAFEMLTAAGLLAARRKAPDVVVCEVGLGGRLDSTNVVDLGVAVVTNVGLDHVDRLGDTIEAIAREKAAIIKPGDLAVTGADAPALDVIRERAASVGAALSVVGAVDGSLRGIGGVEIATSFAGAPLRVASPLIGGFQMRNLATATMVCDALRHLGFPIDARAVQRGSEAVVWPGRMQWLEGAPPVLVDGAHNPPGVAALVEAARPLVRGRRVVAVFAAMRDKDAAAMLAELRALVPAALVVTAPAVPRSRTPEELSRIAGTGAVTAPTTAAALAVARDLASPAGAVVVCGSLYLAGEALQVLTPG